MKRNITLNELIERLQKYEKEYGNKQINSIGTSCGDKNQFLFYTNEDDLSRASIKIDTQKEIKEFDFEKFKTEDIAVHCETEAEINNFNEYIKIKTDKDIFKKNDITFNYNDYNICYIYDKDFDDFPFFFYDEVYLENTLGYRIIEWKDYMN